MVLGEGDSAAARFHRVRAPRNWGAWESHELFKEIAEIEIKNDNVLEIF